MAADPLHPLEPLLHADGAALRRLARGLLARDDVDDVVQDAAVAALGPPHGARTDLAGWLRGVVRNLAAMRHRTETRRRARERAVAADPIAPPEAFDPAALASHAETTAAVSDAVRALDEPYRSVVVLRFWHGRSAAEIAHHLGVPHDTVRSRLQRGLERLRQRLDARFGARERWSAPLLVLAGRATPAAAPTTWILATTGALMKTKWMLAAAAALAAAIVLPFSLPHGANPLAPDGPGAGIVAENASLGARAPGDDADVGSREVAAPPAATGTSAVPRDHVLVRGRCVDGDGKAVAGCATVVQTKLPLAHEPTQPVAAGTTDSAGRFELTFVPIADACTLSLRANGFATVQCQWVDLRTGAMHDLGDVVLPRGGGVTGRVVDGRGQPLPGVAVTLYGGVPTPSLPSPQAAIDVVTDADGSFAASALAPGEWTAAVTALRLADAPRARAGFRIAPGTMTTGLELACDGVTAVLAGIVVDAAGAPLVGAVVGRTSGVLMAPCSGVDGTFTILRMANEDSPSVGLRATAPGFEPEVVPALAWGRRDVRIVLRRCAVTWLEVVHDDDGAPVRRYALHVAQAPGTRSGIVAQIASPLLSREGGRARLEGLPRGDYVAWIDPGADDGDAPGARELAPFFGTFTIHGDPEHVRLRAPRAGTRTVRVVDARQTPVAGTRLELVHPVRGDAVSLRTPAAPPRDLALADALRVAEAVTDETGEAVLRAAAGIAHALRVLGPGHRPLVVPDVVLGDGIEPLVIRVEVGASVFGTVTPPEVLAQLGASPQERDMAAKSGERGATLLRQWQPQVLLRPTGGGADHPEQAIDGAVAMDGSYRIDGVPPGSWQVCLRLRVRVGDGTSTSVLVAPLATVRDLQSGEERRFDLDCTPFGRGALDALVLVDGEPLRNAPVSLLYRRDGQQFGATAIAESAHRAETDAEGRLRVDLPPGEWAVEVEVEGRSADKAKLRNEQIAIVAPGATTGCTFALQRRVLRVRIVRPDGTPEADRRFSILQQSYLAGAGSTDADGRLVLESMPTGAFELVTWPVELATRAAQTAYIREHPYPQWLDVLIRLGPVSLPTGHTEGEVELRMPR